MHEVQELLAMDWHVLRANSIPAILILQLHRPLLLEPRLHTHYKRAGIL